MAPPGKLSGFHLQGHHWFSDSGLPSDITVSIDGVNFHLHKFPLVSRCGKIARTYEDSKNTYEKNLTVVLEEFPGGPETFLIVAKFCYGFRVELTAKNVVLVHCAAEYLEMTDEYEEGNLLTKSESFFHKNILRNWKDCILALQSSEPILSRAENLNLVDKCLNALSMMACTDPSLFGWPMMMYGSFQSPGGSILWNGINTGARIRTSESEWWFEDISYLSVRLFESLIKTMRSRGMRPESLAGAIMYYSRKHLPGLGRWQGGQGGKTRTVASFSLTPASATVDQRVLLESIEKLLPQKKGKSFCRFLLGLLRVASILNVDQACKESLERRIGMQLELATLDSLLIPAYADSDALYNTDCIENIVHHFVLTESNLTAFSPSSLDPQASSSSESLRKVAKLIDSYIGEIASDVNLKPEKLRALAQALPESSRSLHDGLYRAIDIYFKAHPWLSDNEKEEICNIIDYQKLSIHACAHASQNDRLPLRVVLQVLFFEQLHLRTALAGCVNALDGESAPAVPAQSTARRGTAGEIVQRDGWVAVVRENQGLKVDMDRMSTRVGELEEEFSKIKKEMKTVTKSHSARGSPRLLARKLGCKLVPRFSDAQPESLERSVSTPRASVERARRSHKSRHTESFS
ncbi:putative SKP1/BTB/POZ domain, NPH3 domain-containing protein [Medicago truncatula]|uniref:Phototropic-responsive NPH3 family protein n=1 Tax=Medicago truncatula TaxID=3880 RepID=A0A072VA76_MEDTR|nr:BTB/POZ domain-containing protein At3g44820 [Medicago truncatula]KEH38919.1 phototropic-responsive NPH3 family protein [Medicago truncatula]RHN75392.1 putative SKP1/BTB/POZ domain, NPH3 domain-containing protein [Medicago truncatula]